MNPELRKLTNGTYQEVLADKWTAEYAEDPATGLWEVVVLKQDVNEWRETGYATIEDAQRAAHEFHDQS